MFAIALQPGQPVRQMWARAWDIGEKKVGPPPEMGRFGMSENRHTHLRSLAAHMHSISEDELDDNDPWRYVNLAIDEYNAQWERVYAPSWLLAPDESMCQWTAPEGIRPQDIPFLSHIPRKPKPLGCELKAMADGESGAIIRIEPALKHKRRRGDMPAVAAFEPRHGKIAASCLRLARPWLHSGRAFGADAHFISMESARSMREEVCRPHACMCCPAPLTHSLRCFLCAGSLPVRRPQGVRHRLPEEAARGLLRPGPR